MIARLGRLPVARRASGSSTTPSTSSTATATTPSYALACLRRRGRGGRRERHALRHQRRQPARADRRGDRGGRRARSARRRGRASTRTTTPSARSPTRWPRSRRARRLVQGTINGYRRALRQRQPGLDPPDLQLKLGYGVRRRRAARAADRDRALRRRAAATSRPDPDQPYVGRNAFAHKGGMHVAGVSADARTFEHIDPALVGNQRELLVSELSGKGDDPRRSAERGRARARRRGGAAGGRRGSRSASTAATTSRRPTPPSSCCCARRPASYEPLFRLESFRVIAEKRADGKVETEATIKIWVDGERYVRTAEGNGPVNALDRALRGAIADRPSAPRRHRAGQLQGPDPRRDTTAPARSRACCSTPPTASGSGARSASRRTSSRPPGRRCRLARVRVPARWRRTGGATPDEPEPSRSRSRGRRSARARRSWCSRCCARAGSRWARCWSASSATSPPGSGSSDAVAVSSGTAALHLGVRALGLGRGRRGRDQPVQLRRLGQLPPLRGRAAGLLRRRPGHPQPRSGGRRGGGRRAHGRDPAGPHLRLPGRHAGARGDRRRHGLGILEDACEALGAVDAEGRRSALAATSPPSPSTPTSS